MVGRLRFSAQEYLFARWQDEKWRKPFLFSSAIHLTLLLVILLPSSLFTYKHPLPMVYSVDLIDLTEAPPPPAPEFPPQAARQETVPSPPQQTASLEPVLSTRTIPTPPSEIKLIRPQAIKRDLRPAKKDIPLPPLDPTVVLAALNRIEQEEKARQGKEQAMKAIRDSIMTRPSGTGPAREETPPGSQATGRAGNSQQGGVTASTVLDRFKAQTAQHISKFWVLPEGQIWPRDLRASALIRVRPDGIVTSSELVSSSKNSQFDKFVMQTIKEASPLPPVPEEIANIPLRIHFYPEGML